MLKTYNINEIPVRIHGRTATTADGLPLRWTGAAAEFAVTGTELWLTYAASGVAGDFLRVEIDGFDFIRLMLEEGEHRVCIFKKFPAEQTFRVRILREMQATGGALTLRSLDASGSFAALPARRHKIEFLGDSITSGEGLAGAASLNVWIPQVFSTRGNYALLTADALDADYSILSMSGWGIYCSWNNNPKNAIPVIYESLCAPGGIGTPWDFDDGVDVVVVNLGANDTGAFGGPAFTDEDGTVYQQMRDETGAPLPECLKKVTDAATAFCARLRTLRPEAHIVWCYGMIPGPVTEALRDAVSAYAACDPKLHIAVLPHADDSLRAARNHPGAGAHRLYADALIPALREILGD